MASSSWKFTVLIVNLYFNIYDCTIIPIGVLRPCGSNPSSACVKQQLLRLSGCTPATGGISLDPFRLKEIWYQNKSANVTQWKTNLTFRGLNASTFSDFSLDYIKNITTLVIKHPLFTEKANLRAFIHQEGKDDIVVDTIETDAYEHPLFTEKTNLRVFIHQEGKDVIVVDIVHIESEGQVTTRMEIAGTSNLDLHNSVLTFETAVAPVIDLGEQFEAAAAADEAVGERAAYITDHIAQILVDDGYNRSRAITQAVLTARVCVVTLLA